MNSLMNPQELDESRRDTIIEQLKMKYGSDPEGFRAYLPMVAAILDAMNPPSPSGRREPPFNLTEQERAYYKQGLSKMLEKLKDGSLSFEQAVKALEHCANLMRDDSLTRYTNHDTRVKLTKVVLGRSHESYTEDTTVRIADEDASAPIVSKISFLRGVYLELDDSMRLISISILPAKVAEFRKMTGFVGMGRDIEGKRDVSLRHDDYLAEIYSRGRF